MKKYFSKRLQTLSGSLKVVVVRIVFKRLPHSLRSFAMTDFFSFKQPESSSTHCFKKIATLAALVRNDRFFSFRQPESLDLYL